MTTSPHPALSVIVPIYGVEPYLRQCVDSILAQSFTDMEIILVDDGSPDACPQMADEYAARDSRVRVIHKANGGYGQSCNMGLDAARGGYVAIVEPDDFIEPGMYSDLHALATQHGSDVVRSDYYQYFDLDSEPWKERAYAPTCPPDKSFRLDEAPGLLCGHPAIWTCIYRTSFLREHGIRFREEPGAGWVDNLFQVQTLSLARKIDYSPRAYYNYRRRELSDAAELKDWTLPFRRSDEIHQWLEEHPLPGQDSLACLYLRELYYIGMVLQVLPHRKHKQARPFIERMLARMQPEILEGSRLVPPKRLREYTQLKQGHYLRYLYPFRQLKRMLLSFKFKKDGFRIQLLGLQLATPRYQAAPALWRIRLGNR